jgi:hypothetical protein
MAEPTMKVNCGKICTGKLMMKKHSQIIPLRIERGALRVRRICESKRVNKVGKGTSLKSTK